MDENKAFWELSPSERRAPDPNRGNILPINGKAPQWVVDTYNALTLPKDTLQGYEPTVGDATNFALGVGGGGLTASSIKPIEADLGMFLGRKAKGANLEKLSKAYTMTSQGVPREEIWKQTGWWQKPDGEWSWEISDDNFDLTSQAWKELEDSIGKQSYEDSYGWTSVGTSNGPTGSISGDVQNITEHPELYKNYQTNPTPQEYQDFTPQQKEDFVSGKSDILNLGNAIVESGEGVNYGGSYNPSSGNINVRGVDRDTIRSVFLHELQHGVQNVEKWKGQGSNPEITSHMYNSLVKQAPENWKTYDKLNNEMLENIKIRTNIEDRLKDLQKEYNKSASKWFSKGTKNLKPEIEGLQNQLSWSEKAFDELYSKATSLKDSSPEVDEFESVVEDFNNVFGFDSFNRYTREEGEMIANLTAARRDLTESERIAIPPWEMLGKKFHSGQGVVKELPPENGAWTESEYSNFMRRRVKKHDNKT